MISQVDKNNTCMYRKYENGKTIHRLNYKEFGDIINVKKFSHMMVKYK